MSVIEAEQRMSVAAFLEWNERQNGRWELVDGFPVKMMAGGKHRHNIATHNIAYAVTRAARSSGCETTTSDTAIVTGEGRIRYPDVVVNCANDDLDDHVASAPTVLVEVLSPGTEWFDLNDKLDEYRGLPSLREILIVSPVRIRVEAFVRRDEQARWASTRIEVIEAVIDLPSIGASVAMADIYRGLDPEPATHLQLVGSSDT